MNLSEREKSLLKAFNRFEQEYLEKRDLQGVLACLDQALTGYGTGVNEDITEKNSYVKLFERDIHTVPYPIISKRVYAKPDLIRDDIGIINTIFEFEATNAEGEKGFFTTRASHLFVYDGQSWKMRHLHASEPSTDQLEDEAYSFQALKRKNLELEKLVAERTRDLEQALKSRDLIMKEVHHRIKNNMFTIQSLLSLHARVTDKKSAEVLQDAASRIRSMMTLYDYLYKYEHYEKANVAEYLSHLSSVVQEAYAHGVKHTVYEVLEENFVQADDLFYIGILANELMINAYKHAYAEGESGSIFLSFNSFGKDGWILGVSDEGKPMSGFTEQSQGFGYTLLSSITEQLHARLGVEPLTKGKKIYIKKSNSE